MRILGIDPGLRVTGFGVLDRVGQKLIYVTSGVVRTPETVCHEVFREKRTDTGHVFEFRASPMPDGGVVRLDAREEVRCAFDAARMDQVASNLLSNAIKYGREAPVDVRVRREADRAILEVVDRGIGVAPEDQERIFDRFERAVSARHFAGIGLGLWIVRQLVEAHGGTIRVRSAPGRGATFSVELPA